MIDAKTGIGMELDKKRTLKIIKRALKEDIGPGDITTLNTIHRRKSIKASIVVNEPCVLCGIDVAAWTVDAVNHSIRFKPQAKDGERLSGGKEIAFLEGHARGILSAERTIFNFLCLLSGIATNVNKFVEKTKKYGVKIYDTRKTFPTLRYLEKYAVEVGNGHNHRFGLWDQILVKENHLKVAKIKEWKNFTSNLKKKTTKELTVEIEVENLEQFKKVLVAGAGIILLDNMSTKDVKKAVELRNKIKSGEAPNLEVSGGINIDNVEEYAKTGVDRISIGSLTDSVKSVDMSLEI